MMRKLWLLAALIPLAFAAHAAIHGKPFTWSASLSVPTTDPNSVHIGGTEGRQFAVYNAGSQNAVLYWGNGYWMDSTTPASQANAQVLALTSPLSQGGKWTQVLNMGGASYCPSDNLNCALAVSALASLPWKYDAGGNSVNVTTVVAASWFHGASDLVSGCTSETPMYSWTLNNVDGLWYQTMVSCELSGDGTAQLRSYDTYQDQVLTNTQYALVGGAPSGIWHGQLNTSRGAGQTLINWATGATCPNTSSGGAGCEWSSANYPGSFPSCTSQIRVMSFAHATGTDGITREYMSACFGVFVRIDGAQSTCNSDQVLVGSNCVQRWQPYWQSPDGANATSESGLRGLTELIASGAQVLLTGAEGSGPQNYYQIPPVPGCATITSGIVTITSTTCATPTWGIITNSNAATGMTIGNTVAPYNNFPVIFDQTGTGHRFAPQSNYVTSGTTAAPAGSGWTFMALADGATGKKWGEATFTERSVNGGTFFNLVVAPQLFSTPMNGVRDITASPWPSECVGGNWPNNCALYVTGFDADGAGEYYWCQTTPCPSSPSYVPMQNTAWIARWGP